MRTKRRWYFTSVSCLPCGLYRELTSRCVQVYKVSLINVFFLYRTSPIATGMPTMYVSTPAHPLEVFFSYSHRDVKMRNRLEAHLSSLKREHLISGWHDRKIKPGTEWKGQIDTHLDSSQII